MYGYNLNGSLLFSSKKIRELSNLYLGEADEELVYSTNGIPYWDDATNQFRIKEYITEIETNSNFLTDQINQI